MKLVKASELRDEFGGPADADLHGVTALPEVREELQELKNLPDGPDVLAAFWRWIVTKNQQPKAGTGMLKLQGGRDLSFIARFRFDRAGYVADPGKPKQRFRAALRFLDAEVTRSPMPFTVLSVGGKDEGAFYRGLADRLGMEDGWLKDDVIDLDDLAFKVQIPSHEFTVLRDRYGFESDPSDANAFLPVIDHTAARPSWITLYRDIPTPDVYDVAASTEAHDQIWAAWILEDLKSEMGSHWTVT